MTKRVVDLVIRARNEADRAVNSISSALKDLSNAQKDVQLSSAGTGTSIGKLGASFRNLDRLVDQAGDKSARAFKNIENAVDKATGALSKQRSALRDSYEEYGRLASQVGQAEGAINRIEAAIEKATSDGDAAEVQRLQIQWRGVREELGRLEPAIIKVRGDIDAQTRAVNRGSEELRSLQGAATAGQIAMREFGESSVRTSVELNRASGQLQRTSGVTLSTGAAMGSAANQGYRLRDAFRSIYGEGRSAMSLMQRMRGEMLALASASIGLYQAINQLGQVINSVATIESIENRLGAVFEQDTTRVVQEMRWLQAQAARLGIDIGTLGDQYTQYAVAANEAGFSGEAVRHSFLAVAEAGRTLSLTNDQVRGTFYALTQMISKGKIQAEELRRQLGDRLTGAFQIFAAAIGVSTEELDAMLDRGDVIATERTFVNFADALTERFGGQLPAALESTRAELGRLDNAILNSRLIVGEAGFSEAFLDAIRTLRGALTSDEGREALARIGEGLANLVNLGVQIGTVVANNFETFLFLIRAFVAIKLTPIILSITRSFNTGMTPAVRAAARNVIGLQLQLTRLAVVASGPLRVGLMAAVSAMRLFRGVMVSLWAAIGGLPGLLATALTFVASDLLGRWIGGANRATAALRQHQRMLERIQQDYAEVGDDAEEWARRLRAGATRSELEADLRDLQESYRDTIQEIVNSARRNFPQAHMNFPQEFNFFNAEFWNAVHALEQGTISVEEFRSQIDELREAGQRMPDGFIQYVRDLVEGSEEGEQGAIDLREAIDEVQAAIILLEDPTNEAALALLGLAEAMDDTSENADASRIREFTEALNGLRAAIPALRRFDRFRDSLSQIEAARDRALENADESQRSEINRTYDRSRAALTSNFLGDIDYDRIIDRTTSPGSENEVRRQAEESLRAIAARLLEAGADVTEESILAVSLGASVEDVTAGTADLSEARSALSISGIEIQRQEELTRVRRNLAEAQREFNREISVSNARSEYALSLSEESEQEQRILLAIFDAQAEARRRDLTFTEEQASAIRDRIENEDKLTAMMEHRTRELDEEKLSAQEIVDLLQRRQQLLQEQIQFSLDLGEPQQAELLREQLVATNEELRQAIENAIAFWSAMGGPEAENARLELEALRRQLDAMDQQVVVTGRQINEMLASGGADAFDNFAQGLANGENALRSFRDAFLQFAADFLRQIAQMIIQQMIFNAISGAFGGGSNGAGGIGGKLASGINAGVNHDGGMIGERSPRRSVAASYFANAMRYHSGGMVGLKPNERPIIAELGEEVLTRDDPRHRGNAGGGGFEIHNHFDKEEAAAALLGTEAGKKGILNVIRLNPGLVKQALGG